ncbi:MAG TPA: PEP-CTERM sorting domain-containing protein [Bryobacteraceae bacterium]|nr:PEP-CTERM sorting domain-containing protein [Bryobacteraceae bacterium]
MTIWKRLRAPCFAGTLALLTLGAGIASADTFTSTLSTPNSALSAVTGPYGEVLVSLTSSTMATITFTADSGFLFTDGSSVAANGSFSFTSATGDCSSCAYSSGGTGNVDGVGSYNAIVDSGNSGPGGRSSTITLDVTATGSTMWSSASQVLSATGNGSGFDAAAHIFVTSGANTGLTGFAAEPAGTVPEPTAILLLGSSMIGLGAIVRRRRSTRSAQS